MSLFAKFMQGRGEKREAAKAAARADFWVWFQENTGFLETYASDTAAVIGAVGERINAVSRDLAFEMGQADDGVYEFIVSADGIKATFPEVVALTKTAPTIAGWRVIAFRPRKPGAQGQVVRFEGADLSTGAVWYRSHRQDDKLDIALCVQGQDQAGARALLGPIFLLLDATLGEYDVGTRIGVIDLEDCPADPAAAGMRPVAELAHEVDSVFAEAHA